MTVKTLPTKASVPAFIKALPTQEQKDARLLLALMKKATGEKPVLWGTDLVGFGSYVYTYASGKTGVWPKVAFAMRKDGSTVYIMQGFSSYTAHLKKLGNPKHGGSCLYLKSLGTIDMVALSAMVRDSYCLMTKKYPDAKKK